jgi:transposase
MRDELAALYEDHEFAHLFATRGRPAESPWRLALVTIFQFAENLSDRQAADALRARIDWKYALGLELADAGFDASVLCEFRGRLVAGGAEDLLLEVLLERFTQRGLLKGAQRQRTDSTHVLAAIRGINRLELVKETMRSALEHLAVLAPSWLLAHSQPEWRERYKPCFQARLPTSKDAQRVLAEAIGADGGTLLDAVYATAAPPWLRYVPAIAVLRRIWLQNYIWSGDQLQWRSPDTHGLPPAGRFISSPHDLDARYSKKDTMSWVGYKVHLTETCTPDTPNLITHVTTTPATTADGTMTPAIHQALQEKALLPTTHLVDTGYLDAELLVHSQQVYGVDLLGPTRKDQRWQARAAEGFGVDHFMVDWEHRQAVCPEGHASLEWVPRRDNRGNESIYIRFSPSDCGPCPSRARCTRSQAKYPRRAIAIRPQAQYEALQRRRTFEGDQDYVRQYAKRAGIEGTISQGVRRSGMRRSRYRGHAKTHLQHVLTAAAINFVRVANWLAGVPRAQTRRSHFSTLTAQRL